MKRFEASGEALMREEFDRGEEAHLMGPAAGVGWGLIKDIFNGDEREFQALPKVYKEAVLANPSLFRSAMESCRIKSSTVAKFSIITFIIVLANAFYVIQGGDFVVNGSKCTKHSNQMATDVLSKFFGVVSFFVNVCIGVVSTDNVVNTIKKIFYSVRRDMPNLYADQPRVKYGIRGLTTLAVVASLFTGFYQYAISAIKTPDEPGAPDLPDWTWTGIGLLSAFNLVTQSARAAMAKTNPPDPRLEKVREKLIYAFCDKSSNPQAMRAHLDRLKRVQELSPGEKRGTSVAGVAAIALYMVPFFRATVSGLEALPGLGKTEGSGSSEHTTDEMPGLVYPLATVPTGLKALFLWYAVVKLLRKGLELRKASKLPPLFEGSTELFPINAGKEEDYDHDGGFEEIQPGDPASQSSSGYRQSDKAFVGPPGEEVLFMGDPSLPDETRAGSIRNIAEVRHLIDRIEAEIGLTKGESRLATGTSAVMGFLSLFGAANVVRIFLIPLLGEKYSECSPEDFPLTAFTSMLAPYLVAAAAAFAINATDFDTVLKDGVRARRQHKKGFKGNLVSLLNVAHADQAKDLMSLCYILFLQKVDQSWLQEHFSLSARDFDPFSAGALEVDEQTISVEVETKPTIAEGCSRVAKKVANVFSFGGCLFEKYQIPGNRTEEKTYTLAPATDEGRNVFIACGLMDAQSADQSRSYSTFQ